MRLEHEPMLRIDARRIGAGEQRHGHRITWAGDIARFIASFDGEGVRRSRLHIAYERTVVHVSTPGSGVPLPALNA